MKLEHLDRFKLSAKDACLLVIDMQERLAQAMAPDTYRPRELNVMNLVRCARELDLPIVVTEQYPRGLGTTTAPVLRALGADVDVSRLEKVCFAATDLGGFAAGLRERGVRSCILTGMETHVCVYQTALGLLDSGFHVWVARDAVVSRTDENWRTGLDLMNEAGCLLSSTEAVCFQLLGRAGTPEFKAVAPYLRDPAAAWNQGG